ncbi:MAG TPA: hypothetical protein VIE43_25720 [Thermoanaerobaculia bacterium]|nr:hypothetical protein [Thermoanaerobaculia bacterium]
MPELTPESSSPPSVPAAIDPTAWEDFPVFRESFLMYISEPSFNAALRTTAEHFFGMLLETYQRWPAWQETSTRTEIRAALGDLRHLQGFLASIGQERHLSSLDAGDFRLSKHASQVARLLKQVGDTMDRKLAKGAA